jgi:hypothetical protein
MIEHKGFSFCSCAEERTESAQVAENALVIRLPTTMRRGWLLLG